MSSTNRRRFSATERSALFLSTDGHCVDCGEPLSEDWEADHRLAFAAGGETDVVNGAPPCAICNTRRGARDAADEQTTGLRSWQRAALAQYETTTPKDFLVVATPGAGKTRLGGTIAGRHLRSGRADQVIVVTPTERLKGQWADAVAGCGVQLEPNWTNATGVFPNGFDGVAVTYAQVAALPDLFRRHASRRRTIVLFDEVHHCGDSRRWGDAARHAFEPAAWRIALSGTPFRSDNNAIPFIRYVDGVGQPDVTYDYSDAIRDGVCRAVFFPRRGGRMEWAAPTGEVMQATFDDELDEQSANQRLRTALSIDGDWLPAVLADAQNELTETRSSVPDAGGLVIAADQNAARYISDILLTRHGVHAVVVVSDEPDANDRIERFAVGDAPWLVSVRMVSEGVDIPRLRVGVYATPVTTELFFGQAVGRLVRVVDRAAGETASCYIPDDARLRRYAATIREQRDHVLDEETDVLLETDRSGPRSSPLRHFQPIASEVIDAGGTFDGAELTASELAYAEQLKAQTPQTSTLPTPAVAVLLRIVGDQTPTASDPPPEPPAHRRRRDLRAANSRVASRIVYATGLGHAEVNTTLNAAVGVTGVAIAGVDELTERLRIAQRWLNGEPPAAMSA